MTDDGSSTEGVVENKLAASSRDRLSLSPAVSPRSTPLNIAIITGEASGDRVGAQLAEEIRRRRPDVHIWGTGGKYLRGAGVEVVVDSAHWGVVGIVSGLQIIPRVLRALNFVEKELIRRRPNVVIPIDAGAVNIGFAGLEGICPFIRKHLPETRILYYFPPGSWRRTVTSTQLTRLADKVAAPFPWNEGELRRFGVDATFVGHPLLDLVHPAKPKETFASEYGIDRTRPVVGILPGSRLHEIEVILPIQLSAASIIHQRVPAVQFLIALAPTVERGVVERAIERARQERRTEATRFRGKDSNEKTVGSPVVAVPAVAEGPPLPLSPAEVEEQRKKWLARATEIPDTPVGDYPVAIVEDATYDVMAASDVLLITSGTATLEATILGKPMVIVYRMSSANKIEYAFVKKRMPKYIGMPNLLAERSICPELIQDDVTPEALASEVIGLLLEPDRMLRMRDELRSVTTMLGRPGGAARTAEMVIQLAEESAGNASR
jgi:lipid-A-disaccharide synthase